MIAEKIQMDTPAFFDGYYGTARLALLHLLPTEARPRTVLEIGCGSGANLAELKRRYPDCITTGVELEPRAASIARTRPGVDRLVQADVADVNLPTAGFDLIVLSHVLEHFARPELVLAQCRSWLHDGGHLLVALPNLRHVLVVGSLLLKGEFRYQDAGILDRTHLRFFTRRSAHRLLTEQGYAVQRVQADIEGRRSRLLDRLSFGMAQEFAAFAYNFLAVKA